MYKRQKAPHTNTHLANISTLNHHNQVFIIILCTHILRNQITVQPYSQITLSHSTHNLYAVNTSNNTA